MEKKKQSTHLIFLGLIAVGLYQKFVTGWRGPTSSAFSVTVTLLGCAGLLAIYFKSKKT